MKILIRKVFVILQVCTQCIILHTGQCVVLHTIYAILLQGNLCRKFTLFCYEEIFVANLRTFKCKISGNKVREWENGEEMERERENGGRMRKWRCNGKKEKTWRGRKSLSLHFSPSLYFRILSPFSLSISFPFSRSLAISSSFCHFASRKLRQPALYSLVALIPLYQSSGTWDTEWRKKLGTAFGVFNIVLGQSWY